MKLTIELIPKTAWYSNVRSNVRRSQWDIIRKQCYSKADHKCEICGDVGTNQGVRHAVECHEIWHYDDHNKKQILTGFIALCPNCHKTKHAGLASVKGEIDIVVKQLMKVNGMTFQEAENYISDSFNVWQERSEHEWKLDISILQ